MIIWMLQIISFILIVLCYPVYLSILLLLRPDREPLLEARPLPVTIIVPTYNEGAFIDRKINNLLNLQYPQDLLEIIFVDGNSNDGTRERLLNHAQRSRQIRVIAEDRRQGKASALNAGLRSATADTIVISDADALLEPDTLELLVRRLESPHYGLSGAYVKVEGRKEVVKNEDAYWKLKNSMRVLEASIDSPFSVVAACYAFRRDTISSFEREILADDMWACMKVREEGYRVDYLLEAKAYDYGVAGSMREDFLHKVRKGFADLQVFRRFTHMLFNVKYGWFGMFILPSHMFRYIVCPYACLIFLMTSIFLLATETMTMLGESLMFIPFIIWGGIVWSKIMRLEETRLSYSAKILFRSILMFFILQIALILSQISYGQFHKVGWKKIR